MSYMAACVDGLEDIAIDDVREITGNKARKVKKSRIIFDCKDIGRYIKSARSVSLVYELIGKFKFNSLDEIEEKSKKLDYSFIKKDFVVRCNRQGQHDFNSIDVERTIGQSIYDKGYAVNLRSRNIIIADIMENDCFIGILHKDGMCKRDYRVRINKQGINACMAYSLVKLVGWKKDDSLLDPNCRDGVILIEAGLSGGNKLYGMDSNRGNFLATDVNAKVAKVKIEVYEKDMSEINQLFKSVDYIVTFLPSESKNISKNFINRLYNSFFSSVKDIKFSRMAVLVLDDRLLKEFVKDFNIVERREIESGIRYVIYILEQI